MKALGSSVSRLCVCTAIVLGIIGCATYSYRPSLRSEVRTVSVSPNVFVFSPPPRTQDPVTKGAIAGMMLGGPIGAAVGLAGGLGAAVIGGGAAVVESRAHNADRRNTATQAAEISAPLKRELPMMIAASFEEMLTKSPLTVSANSGGARSDAVFLVAIQDTTYLGKGSHRTPRFCMSAWLVANPPLDFSWQTRVRGSIAEPLIQQPEIHPVVWADMGRIVDGDRNSLPELTSEQYSTHSKVVQQAFRDTYQRCLQAMSAQITRSFQTAEANSN